MTIIHAKTQDQVLVATILPKVACNNKKTVKLHVEFDAAWDGFAKTAIFYTSNDPTIYPVTMSSAGECTIPHEVLAEAGYLFITIQGANSASAADKSTTPIKYKVLPGTPSMIVSDPSPNLYEQLASKDAALSADVATERARISNLAKLKEGSTTGDAELADMRVDFTGKTHSSAGEAFRATTKKLTNGRFGLATLLPSGIGNYPTISTVDKTFTIGGDTLIISDRLSMGFVSLHKNNGNDTVTWGDEITSSAICFYYDIANNKLVAKNYSDRVEELNYILVATLRIGGGSNPKSWAVCSSPIYVDGKLSTEVNSFGGFAALLPPMNDASCYPKFSTKDNTVVFARDTLIVDPRLKDNYVSLQEEKGNDRVNFGDFTTSAVCVYYGISEEKLIAKPYNEKVNTYDYLLLCTVRKAPTQYEIPMAWASCPVWIDDRLSTDVNVQNVYENDNINSVNHRGYSEAPENTISAFKLSHKKGFKYVECDVSFTSDGMPVLLHDGTVDRTSNGTGNISAMTFEAVRALDFGSWKSEDYAGEKIPTFEEFIALCRNLGLHPYIELKQGTADQIGALAGLVKRYGMKGKVTWISFVPDFLALIKTADPEARLGYVVSEVTAATIKTVTDSLKSDVNEVFIDCAAGNATAKAVQLCADADIPLEVWTVNTEDGIKALDPYISGVTSDNLTAGGVLVSANIGETVSHDSGITMVYITGFIPYNNPTVITDTGYNVVLREMSVSGETNISESHLIMDVNKEFTIEGNNLTLFGAPTNLTAKLIEEIDNTAEGEGALTMIYRKYKCTITGTPAILSIITAD